MGRKKSEYKLWQKQKVNKSKYKDIVFDIIPFPGYLSSYSSCVLLMAIP